MSEAFFQSPILNSPYDEPARHWELDAAGQPTNVVVPRRRPSALVSPIPKAKKVRGKAIEQADLLADDGQEYNPTEVINGIRSAVESWRQLPESQWQVTATTARLLKHWRTHPFANQRPFFCQVEAVETVIWLTEVAPRSSAQGRRFWTHLAAANEASNPELMRLALKLATGAGKTTVMAMLIAWHSRQGTARFAASLQTNAERGYVRGHIYHAVQGSMARGADTEAAGKLRDEIAELEKVAPDALADLIAAKKEELEALTSPSFGGIAWNELKASLAAAEPVKKWMRDVWQHRDERYRDDPLAFAEFLLLREFNRRPRRGNTAETMGMARLRFDAIDKAQSTPEPLMVRGFGVADWQALLYSMIDMTVRGNFAIRATWADIHWLHTQKPLSQLLAPGQARQGARETPWPMAGKAKGLPSNLILILEKALGLDRHDGQDRARLNQVLEAAWRTLYPLFASNTQPGLALDFAKARVAPVTEAWRCPVTRHALPATALGYTVYGHREHLKTADEKPQPIVFPQLPMTFPRGNQVEAIRQWLDSDDRIEALRMQGVWSNLHDRVALLSPYLRAAEHSAQQPPARLRRFEREFKKGEINILNCSTTMEMGVDIGSVSAVMMTNVPPALANYRQRVGRAGRRKQGFAASLTYTRDTPLDREAFRTPKRYLTRETRAPRVKLDSRPIVQRHVNALLLARWFAGSGGEAMKTRVGDFFGLPAEVGGTRVEAAPVATCLVWLAAPSTAEELQSDVAALVHGTVLAGDRTLFEETQTALRAARDAVASEWSILQQQADGASKEAQASLGYQLGRLVKDNLLKELGYRGVLPAHGFPTGVVPFVNDDKPPADARDDADDSSQRRRSFPTRTLDIAIRDYAPGSEVVVDGLVYRSAGVTLNWLRPVDDVDAREIQSMKTFWSCGECGAADCVHVAPSECPQCHAPIGLDRQRRFLEPAGFTADMRDKPHADTDQITYVEPEVEQIVARGAAWSPMADPVQGRMRASNAGLVFYSSCGPQPKLGYHVCLECGRAAPANGQAGDHPLKDHKPLRFTKKAADGRCPGNDKPFKITPPIALGHEIVTDVVEMQPIGLAHEGAAWAAISALREALARRLGIETSELGMAIRRAATPLGQVTHSLFLYDRASGGAGFAPQAVSLYEALLGDAEAILDCPAPGCTTGCSACVLTADLYRQAEIIDRIAAFRWIHGARAALADVPPTDRAAPDAVLVRSVADCIAEAVEGGARTVTIWLGENSDVAKIATGRIAHLARRLQDRAAALSMVVSPNWLDSLDAAQRLGLRDTALQLGLTICDGSAPSFANGAIAIAAAGDVLWASRDSAAASAGEGWGEGLTMPVVRIGAPSLPLTAAVDLGTLLPVSGTHYLEIEKELDGPIGSFGERIAALLVPEILAAGTTAPLVGITYNDRYLQSPLVVRLMAEALAALRNALAGAQARVPARIITNRLRPNERQPFAPGHDWQFEEDRAAVLTGLLDARAVTPELVEHGADHGRVLTLDFADGFTVRVIFDQGFGPWRTPHYTKWHHFGDTAAQQIKELGGLNAHLAARAPSYIIVTSSEG